MIKIDYNQIFEKTAIENKGKKLLLHACCAPCSTAVLEKVTPYFDVSLFFYNPNIDMEEEYFKRAEELKKLQKYFDFKLIIENYDNSHFLNIVKGLEQEREGGARCGKCFDLRLGETAKLAAKQNFDYFGTTLTLSPHKNSALINQIGEKLSLRYNIKFLYSDFKKKEGYKRSIELSAQFKLYRQSYCGCGFGSMN